MHRYKQQLKTRLSESLRAWLALAQRRQQRRVRMWDPGYVVAASPGKDPEKASEPSFSTSSQAEVISAPCGG